MKFAHIADCHIGGWREPKLRELGLRSFEKAIDTSIQERVGFVLLAGDLFDTALPQIDLIKDVTRILSKLRQEDIPIYIIPGSHDFSVSGKTMLDVLEKAELVENVVKLKGNKLSFTEDRTGTKISGYLGRKGGLEKYDYEKLDFTNLEEEKGFKIFMFHTLLEQLKEGAMKELEGQELKILPKGFNYYAGGHPHFTRTKTIPEYGVISYPGPTFPNNFKELEELKEGGFFIVETQGGELKTHHIKVKIKEVQSYTINAEGKTTEEVREEIEEKIKDHENKIITLRIEGELKEGKPSDLKLNKLKDKYKEAYLILSNSSKLKSKEFEEEYTTSNNKIEEIEEEIITKNLSKTINDEKEMIKELSTTLYAEKQEGERIYDFEQRMMQELTRTLSKFKIDLKDAA